jgi:cell division protein FtsB
VKGKLPRISFKSRRSRTPSVQALIVIFISLFILFLWLNFVLTQQNESIGREIQATTKELQSLERQGDAYRQEFSEKESQKNMSERARLLGYQPQTPFFLSISQPLAQPVSEAPVPVWQSATLASSEGLQAQTSNRLWILLARQFAEPESATAP